MTEVTHIFAQIDSGNAEAAEQLLPLVYDELRKLAAARLAHEKPGQTLQATALVHEAYLRLLAPIDGEPPQWHSRSHFFGAAAEAMRRILVENARRKGRIKHGGGRDRKPGGLAEVAAPEIDQDLLALDDALQRLTAEDPTSAELVKLRFFAGLTIPQAADVLGVSPRKADFMWSFARAWLRRDMGGR